MTWVPMLDYSLRNKVSLSTLRRRIKAKVIEYKSEAGRYLIKESETADSIKETGSSLETTQLIQELKRVYSVVLSEKEEMISQLKNEIEDLKKIHTLLEREIDRTSGYRTKLKDL